VAPVRPEQRIAVVSHAGFIRHTLSAFARGLSGAAAEALEREFLNCELRTVVRSWCQVFPFFVWCRLQVARLPVSNATGL